MRSYADITDPQQAAIDRLYNHNQTLLVAPKGFGKAVVGQTAAQELLGMGWLKRILVVAPLKVCQLTWATEHVHWDHLEPPAMALGDASQRKAAIDSGAPLVVINFENIPWLFRTYGAQHGFDGLLIDESTKCKAAGSSTVKALRKRLKDFKWRAAMTADAVAEMGTDIYTQALMVDGGKALGRNQEIFRRKYFYPTDYNQFKWAVLPGMDRALADALSDILFVAEAVDYEANLPELVEHIQYLDMPKAARLAYLEMERDEYLAMGDTEIEAVNAGVMAGKLQQITAGAIYDAKGQVHSIHQTKFQALDAILQEACSPVAVAYNFIFELDALKQRYPHIAVLGDDPAGVEAAWNRGDLRLMALHPKSASHGLNLQYGGHELVVMSAPWGADPWEQLIGRFRRRGQKSSFVRRTVLVMRDTIDEVILDRHMAKAYDSKTLNECLADAVQRHQPK